MEKKTKNLITRYLIIVLAFFVIFPLTMSLIACGSGRDKAERFMPNVVSISSSAGYGSGVITGVVEDGLVCLTNYHVVMNSPTIKVTVSDTATNAELLGYSDYHDIAVLKIRATAPEGLTEVRTAEANNGKTNFSIGNSNNKGIVVHDGECINRGVSIRTERLSTEGTKYVPVIETAAKIELGMSGGALLDDKGNLIGITSYGGSDADYAVPIDIAMAVQTAVLDGRVEEGGRVNLIGNSAYGAAYNDGFIGIIVSQTSFQPAPYGFIGVFEKGKDGEGIRVTRTGANSDIEVGDLVTKIGGLKITTDNRNAVFAELYKYDTDGTGKPLTITLSNGTVLGNDLGYGGLKLKV